MTQITNLRLLIDGGRGCDTGALRLALNATVRRYRPTQLICLSSPEVASVVSTTPELRELPTTSYAHHDAAGRIDLSVRRELANVANVYVWFHSGDMTRAEHRWIRHCARSGRRIAVIAVERARDTNVSRTFADPDYAEPAAFTGNRGFEHEPATSRQH